MTHRLPRFALAVAASVVAAAALSGCHVTIADNTYTWDAPLTKPVAVDIENVRGNVTVRGDGTTDQIIVNVDQWIPLENTRTSQVDAGGDNLWEEEDLSVELIDQEGGAVLVIRSGRASDIEGARLDLEIIMPSLDGALIRNAEGHVVLVDVDGAVRVHNQMGPIDVRTSHPIADEVTLTTTGGNIYLQCPPGSSAEVDMMTLDGAVSFRDKIDESSGTHSASTSSVSGFMGTGGNEMICRTDEGNIYVWMMEDPLAYTRTLRTDIPHPRNYILRHGSKRYTRELSENHPEITGYKDPADRDGY